MDPLISIIVPIYNAEKYLSRCINSILQQSYHNIEVILVNDGSTDNSLKICENYKLADDRVKVIDKQNGGVSSARNHGMDVAKGDFIGFVDSDDYIDKRMYHKLLNCIDNDSDLAVLISNTINISDLLSKEIESISAYEALGYIFKLEFPTSLWSYLYRKDIIGKLRLNEDVHFFEDFEFNTKILTKSNKVSLCKDRLYQYEINNESINSQKINDKKTSCLGIYSRLVDELNFNEDPLLKRKAEYFRAHFVISVILSLANSLDVANRKYFVIAKESAMNIIKDSLKSRQVPIKYKVIIFLTTLSPTYTANGIHLIKSIRKRSISFIKSFGGLKI